MCATNWSQGAEGVSRGSHVSSRNTFLCFSRILCLIINSFKALPLANWCFWSSDPNDNIKNNTRRKILTDNPSKARIKPSSHLRGSLVRGWHFNPPLPLQVSYCPETIMRRVGACLVSRRGSKNNTNCELGQKPFLRLWIRREEDWFGGKVLWEVRDFDSTGVVETTRDLVSYLVDLKSKVKSNDGR